MRDRVGRFQQADGGTLFLDEIGDISWEVQTKLLRVLQQKEFEKVGSSQTISVDVRIIAATHQDLEALIRAGKFREDLFYRLNVIGLRMPALRERREDVFELAVHFLNLQALRAGKAVTQLDESAVEALVSYDWPGNIRELENVIEGAVVMTDGPAVTLEDLPAEVRRPSRRRRVAALTSARSAAAVPASSGSSPAESTVSEVADEDEEYLSYERQRLVDALRDANGNKSSAARLLAMPRSTFFSKLRNTGWRETCRVGSAHHLLIVAPDGGQCPPYVIAPFPVALSSGSYASFQPGLVTGRCPGGWGSTSLP